MENSIISFLNLSFVPVETDGHDPSTRLKPRSGCRPDGTPLISRPYINMEHVTPCLRANGLLAVVHSDMTQYAPLNEINRRGAHTPRCNTSGVKGPRLCLL